MEYIDARGISRKQASAVFLAAKYLSQQGRRLNVPNITVRGEATHQLVAVAPQSSPRLRPEVNDGLVLKRFGHQ